MALIYDDLELQIANCENIPGVQFCHNLTWKNHFQQISNKISTYIWLLSQIKTFTPLQHRMLFYNAYIRPHFEYCCVIWGNSFSFNTCKIEKLQRRACKLIFAKDYSSLEDSRKQLDMLSFEEMIFINKAKIMYKVANNIFPIYLTQMLQLRGSNNDETMALRSDSNKNLKIPRPKLNMFKNSLSYSGAFIWNSIPAELKSATTINSCVNKRLEWMKEDS